MTIAPFAALESRLNTAVQRRLANAIAVFAGGLEVPVLFEDAYALGAVGPVGMAASQPQFDCPSADVPPGAVGGVVVVGGAPYLIAQVMPGVSGMTRVLLEATT